MAKNLFKILAPIFLLIFSSCASLTTNIQKGSGREPQSLSPLLKWEQDQSFITAQLNIFSGNNEKAHEILSDAVKRSPSSSSVDFKLMLAKVEEDLGMYEKAHEHYQILLIENPESESVLKEAAQFYYGMKFKPDAYKLYTKLTKINPGYSNYWIYRGLLALELSDARVAWESFDHLIKHSKDAKHLGHLYMGKLMQLTDYNRKAENEFKKCLKFMNDSKDCVIELARHRRFQGQKKASVKVLSDFLDKHSNRGHKEIIKQLVSWSLEERNVGLAISHLKKLERLSPSDLNIKRKLSALMVSSKNYKDALSRMRLIVENNKSTEKDGLIYFNTLRLNGLDEEAHDFISSDSFMKKAQEKAFFIRFEAQKKKLGEKKAIGEFGKLCERTFNKKECFYVQSYIMWKRRNFSKAQKSLRKALRVGRGSEDQEKYTYFLSQMYYEDQKVKKALRLIDKLILKNESYSPALNFKAYHLVQTNKDLMLAEKLILKALALDPENGHYMDTYGYLLLKTNEYKKALTVLKNAYSILPNEAELVEHLAEAYQKNSEIQMAIRFYTLASDLYTGENRKRIGGKIAKLKSSRNISSVPDHHSVPSK